MKCPKCNHQPMSFIRFFFKLNPLKITCANCNTVLKAGKFIGNFFIGSIIYGFILGITIVYLSFMYNLGMINIVVIFILTILIVGIPAEYIVWNYGKYEVNEDFIYF